MPSGRHLDEARADGPFPKTLLYVNGLVIASSYYFIVFKVDALSRRSVIIQNQHMTNHYGALKGIAKEFPFRKANSYVGAKIVPYIGSTSLSADDVPVNDVSAIPQCTVLAIPQYIGRSKEVMSRRGPAREG